MKGLQDMKKQASVIWLYGLSGSGKSTLANALHNELESKGIKSKRLDGDILRNGLNKDLGFSKEDRKENIRRAAEVAKLFSQQSILVICSFITPTNELRELARTIIGENYFKGIFVNSSLDTCIQRDVKGLYEKALNRDILEFTGISSPFEFPSEESDKINTETLSLNESLNELLKLI